MALTINPEIQMEVLRCIFKEGVDMELFTLETTAELLNKTTQTVRNMVKRGELVAVYPKTGKNGRPNLMVSVDSLGELMINKENRKAGKTQ